MSIRMPILASLVALALTVPAHSAGVEVINGEAAFPEGPIVFDGTLYYAEYGANTVMVWDGKKNKRLWKRDGCGPSAVYPIQKDLLVTCYDSGQIARISTEGKTVALTDKDSGSQPLVGPNDITGDGKGGVYFTASGPWESEPIVGKVYHMGADGPPRLVADDLHYANGLALSADGRKLYVAESEAGRIVSFSVASDGHLYDRRLFVRIGDADPESADGAYPDGLEMGPGGLLYVGQYSKGRVIGLNPDGKLIFKVDVPSAAAPNMAFSEDGKTIYIAAVDDTENAPYAGKVYAIGLR